MDTILSVLPIIILIFLMIRMRVPAHYALPSIAFLVYLILLLYFRTDFALLNSGMATGFWATLTPITVIMGAVLFNNFQKQTGNQAIINRWMSSLTSNPIAQIMIIGYAFAFMIEGDSNACGDCSSYSDCSCFLSRSDWSFLLGTSKHFQLDFRWGCSSRLPHKQALT